MITTTDEITLKDWCSLYEQSTPREREEITFLMLARIADRQGESIETYKRDPDLLAGLSVSDLRDVANKAIEDAHQWMISNIPGIEDLLYAFECLSAFGMGKDETISHMELSEVIAALKDIWTATGETSKAENTLARAE